MSSRTPQMCEWRSPAAIGRSTASATQTRLRTERGQNARRTVVERFDWLRIAEQVEGVYREILAR